MKSRTTVQSVNAGSASNMVNSQAGEEFAMTPLIEKLYLSALCFPLFMGGWNDATLGPVSVPGK